SNSASEGEEQWAFIPTAYQAYLTSLASGTTLYDGPVVVKDIRMYRDITDTPVEVWKTVLIGNFGLTGGGGYFALDVTDPTTPDYLWEIDSSGSFDTMGSPTVPPAMGAVYIDDSIIAREK